MLLYTKNSIQMRFTLKTMSTGLEFLNF